MSLDPGTWVHVAKIGTGRIIEPRGGRRYAVDIKGKIVVVLARDVEPVEGRPRKPKTSSHDAQQEPPVTPHARAGTSIDLHGKTVAEAIAAVEVFVNDALVDGRAEVRIIHGRGSGRVRSAVHRYLRQLADVASFRVDPVNVGVTIVTFS